MAEEILVRDLWVASALMSKGVQYIEAVKNSDGFLEFKYADTPELKNVFSEMAGETLQVDFKKFVSAYRELKDLKYRTK